MNRVINLNHFKTLDEIDKIYPDWLYLGRSGTKLEQMPDGTRVPTPLTGSALANPFKITSGGNREHRLQQYRRWLWQQITRRNPAVLAALAQIGPDTTLACWCAPKHCHCHFAARAATWLREQSGAPDEPAQPLSAGDEPHLDRRATPPLPTRYAPGQKVADTDVFCMHHTHATYSLFVKGKQVFYGHRLDSGTWCVRLAEQQVPPALPTATAGTHRPGQRRKPPLLALYPPGHHVADLSDRCHWHPNDTLSIFEGYKERRYLAHQIGKRWCVPAPAPEQNEQADEGVHPVTPPGTKVADAPAAAHYSSLRTPCPHHCDQLLSVCADGTYAWIAHQLPDGTWCRAE